MHARRSVTNCIRSKRQVTLFGQIACNSSEIEQITSQKLLGLALDSHLNFNEHIDDLCKKVAQRIAVLKKIKRNLPLPERKLFFNALIKLILLYGSCTWTTAMEENVKHVFKLQKQAARVILDASLRDSSKGHFRWLDWLPFKDKVNLQQCSLIY